MDVFGGARGAVADALCLNAGVALAAANVAKSPEEGVKMAQVTVLLPYHENLLSCSTQACMCVYTSTANTAYTFNIAADFTSMTSNVACGMQSKTFFTLANSINLRSLIGASWRSLHQPKSSSYQSPRNTGLSAPNRCSLSTRGSWARKVAGSSFPEACIVCAIWCNCRRSKEVGMPVMSWADGSKSVLHAKQQSSQLFSIRNWNEACKLKLPVLA